VPLDEALLRHGVHVALAIKLFQEGVLNVAGPRNRPDSTTRQSWKGWAAWEWV
jgi:hypothetical protein